MSSNRGALWFRLHFQTPTASGSARRASLVAVKLGSRASKGGPPGATSTAR